MLHLNKVHHIAIICSDYQRSLHFYTTHVLGMRVLAENYREERLSYKTDLACKVIELFTAHLFKFCHNYKLNWNLLFSALLFGENTNKIPHDYPKDDYGDKSHGESCVRKQVTLREVYDAMKCSAQYQ